MKVSPNTQKIFVSVVVLLLLGFLGYQMFIQEAPVADSNGVPTGTVSSGQEIVALVNRLDKISINQNVFIGPAFVSLRDFTQTIFPEPKGRLNPFASIGSDLSLPTTQTPPQRGR